MIATNDLLNRINDWNAPEQSAFKRHIGSRFTNLCATAPVETLAIAQNILIVPFQVVGMTLNMGAKTICLLTCSDILKDFRANMPTLGDLARTAARIVLYTAGTVFTATIGVLSPRANFKIHCALGLAVNQREEMIKLALLEAEVERLNELAAQKQIEIVSEEVLADAEPKVTENVAAKQELIIQQEAEEFEELVKKELEKLTAKRQELVNKEIDLETSDEVENCDLADQEDLCILANDGGKDIIADMSEQPAIDNVASEVDETSKEEVESPVNQTVKNSIDFGIDEDDILIDFEAVEDTALTKVVRNVLDKGSKVLSGIFSPRQESPVAEQN